MNQNHLISIAGAGPGDPELLTVKALRRLEQADVVLYDALHGNEILDLAPVNALKLYAGKHYQDGQHQTERQDKINSLLKQFACEGKKVVRLKAGDPFIFGRGAEELEFCLAEGLRVEVIPGITSGLAAAEVCRIPVTRRGMNSMALFYTGHKRNGGFDGLPEVAAVLKTNAPVIVYMGLKNLGIMAAELIFRGVDASLPVQIISRACHHDQQVYSTVLGECEAFLSRNDPPMPAVILVGRYAERLSGKSYLQNTDQ